MGKHGATVLALLLAAASTAAAQSGPVGYWKGDDGAGPTNALDSSGFGNNGTYQSGATTSTSVPTLQFPNTHSMQFTTAGAIVDAPGFSWPTGGPVTVAYWNNVTTAQVRNSSAFNVGNTDQPNRFHAHSPWSDSNLYWDYGDIGTTGRISASYTTSLNKWTHVALVSAGIGGNFKAIYLDGVQVATAATSDGPDVPLTGIGIGRWPGPNLDHAGMIDDFRIYDRVLTQAQITALAGGFTEPAAPTGLMATPGLGQIMLTWNASAGATSYNLKYATSTGGPYTTVPVAGTSYNHTGLPDTTTYYYVVSAIGTLGEGPNSPEISATTLTPPPPPPRTGTNRRSDCGCASIPVPGLWPWSLLALALALGLAARR
jgi:hypothetical protein